MEVGLGGVDGEQRQEMGCWQCVAALVDVEAECSGGLSHEGERHGEGCFPSGGLVAQAEGCASQAGPAPDAADLLFGEGGAVLSAVAFGCEQGADAVAFDVDVFVALACGYEYFHAGVGPDVFSVGSECGSGAWFAGAEVDEQVALGAGEPHFCFGAGGVCGPVGVSDGFEGESEGVEQGGDVFSRGCGGQEWDEHV